MTRASIRPPYHYYYYTFTIVVAVVITVIGLLGGEVHGLVAAESWPSELAEFANLQQPSWMYNYLDAPGTVVSSPVALGDEWVVVATTRGVFGMRSSTPTMAAADDDDRLPFHDADALGVTSLFAVGKSRVIAIAHRRVLLYGLEVDTHVSMEDNKTSSTIVRRLASHECPEGYTFDLHSSHSHGGVVPVPVAVPAAATSNNNVNTTTVTTRMMIVLGTGMLSSPPHHQEEDTPSLPRRSSLGLPMEKVGKSHGGSLVYAFDVMTLSLLWVTTTHYDVTNYPIRTSCSQFVWLLAQNYGPDGLLGVNPFYVIRVRKQDGSQSRAALDFNTTYRGTFITMSTESDSFLIVCPSGGFVTGGPLPVADRAPSSPPQMDDEPEHHHNRYEQQRGKKSVDVGSLRYAFHRQSIPSCSTLPSPPFVIHGRWYIPCGEYIHRLSRRVGFADAAGGGGETWANKPTSALLPEPIMQIAHRRDKGIIVVVTAYNAYLVSAAPPPRLRRQSSSFDDDQDQSIMLEHHETDVVSFLTNLDLPTKRHVCTGVTIEVTSMAIPPAGGGGGTGDASTPPHSDEQPMSVVAVLSVAAKTEAPIDVASGYVLVVPCAAAAAAGVRSKSFPKIKMSSGLSPIGPAVLVGGRVFTASAMRPAVQGYSLESGASSSALPVKATVARNSKIDVRPTLTQFHTKHVVSASIAINASSGDVFYATASMLYKRRQALNAVFEPWLMFPRFVDDVTTQMLIIGSSVVIIDTASNIVIVATSSSSSPTAAAATVVGRIIVDALICVLDSRIAPQQLGQVVVLSCDPLTNPLGSPRYYVVHAVSGFVSTLGIIDSHDRWHSGMIGSTRHFCSLSQGSLLLAATSRSTLSAYLMTLSSSSSSRRSPSSIALEKHWEFYEGSMTVLAAPVGWRRGWFFIASNDETGRVALLYMQNQGSSGAATTVLDLTSVSGGGGGGGLSGAAVNKWKVLVVEGSNATTTLFLLSRHGVLSYTVYVNSVGSSSSSSFHVSPLFHYKHPRRFGTIRIQVSRGGPTVVRSRSASSSQQVGLIFLDSRGFANTVFGGSLAWRLEVRDDVLHSALFVTDMRSNVFLPHGRRILGVDLVTGIITSATSWGAEPVHSFAVLSLRTPRLQPHALVVGDSRWGTVFGLVVRLTRVPVELSDSVLKQLTDSGESSKGQWPIQATTDDVVLLSEHCQRARTTSSSSTPSQHEGKNLPFGQQQHRTQPAVLMAETRPVGSISNGGGHVLILCVVLITIMLFFQARRVVVWAKSTWHSIRTGQFRKYLITKTTTSSDVDARGDGSAKEEDPCIALHHLNGPVVAVHAV